MKTASDRSSSASNDSPERQEPFGSAFSGDEPDVAASGSNRSTSEVFRDHLELRAAGELEKDIERNYTEDVVLIHEFGVMRGHEGVRKSGERLKRQIRGGKYEYLTERVEGDYAFLLWRAESDTARMEHGVDTFAIRAGRIVMQTVHFELHRGDG